MDTVVVAEANPLAKMLFSKVLNEVGQRHEFKARIVGPLDDPKLTNTSYGRLNPGAPVGQTQPAPTGGDTTARPTPQPAPGEAPQTQTQPQPQKIFFTNKKQ